MDVFEYKIDIFHISYVIALLSFITLFESVFHGYFALVFIPKFLVRVTFVRITSAPALFLLPVIYCENCEYEIFEAILQGVAKSNPTEKQIDAEIQATLRHAWKLTEEKM